ncbi:MAG: NYN domain-containing protein [Candidatus Komeilibacteria bacterium]|nr:NYN domain-containing protein [Candidatus Komeilibacteria bacterium]
MKSDLKNYAYIDGNNLHRGTKEFGWLLDYFRFRRWLTEKYQIQKAYIFLGFITSNQGLYKKLRRAGFILIFKTLTYEADGKAKGNCDAELVLRTVIDYYENRFDQAVLVSGDGDFACLTLFLLNRRALKSIIAPSGKYCSYLIRRIQCPLLFLNNFKNRLFLKEKAPGTDETVQGSSSY